MAYNKELEEIKRIRRHVFLPDVPVVLMILLGVGSKFILPILAPIFGVAIAIYIYRKFIKAAHAPCPQCGESFGTTARWPLGFGTLECQNCRLKLYQDSEL